MTGVQTCALPILEVFKDLIRLEVLNLSSNQLKSLDGKLLQFNHNLVEINFSNNEIENIGEDILNYSQRLVTFDFTENQCYVKYSTNKNNVIQNIIRNCWKA